MAIAPHFTISPPHLLQRKSSHTTDYVTLNIDTRKLFVLLQLSLGPCTLDDFKIGPILGTGSFGRVSIARHVGSGKVVAIKMLSKAQILRTKQVMHIKAEKDILQTIAFPFIVQLHGFSQVRHAPSVLDSIDHTR